MDNLAAPIPPISPQPAAASLPVEALSKAGPAESSSRRWLLWSAIGLTFLIFGIAIGVFSAKFFSQSTTQPQISTYQDCLAAKGSLVQESYPATCVTVSGQRFVQPLTDEEKQGLQPPDLYREPTSSAATSDWKTYQSQVLTFKYPPDWRLDTNGKLITSVSPTIDLWVFGKDDPMMNECMEEKNRKTMNNLLIKYFSHVQGTEACSNPDTWSQKEIWIVKTGGDGFQPGVIYSYSSNRLAESEAIFDQILSTFKFTD